MTETENEYFAVSVDQWDKISFHKTEEDAKKECLKGAEELLDYAIEIDDISVYKCQIHNAVYGVVLGKAESKTNVDSIIEKPEIVEFPQDNGWISVKNSLPPNHQNVLACNRIALFICRRCNDSWFSDIGMYPCEITHWRPLPPPPKNE